MKFLNIGVSTNYDNWPSIIGRKSSILINNILLWGDQGVPDSERYQVIGVALFNGAGTAAILVSSLSLTAQLIGKNTSTAAFVYGAMSLTDKIANGVAVIIGKIQVFIKW